MNIPKTKDKTDWMKVIRFVFFIWSGIVMIMLITLIAPYIIRFAIEWNQNLSLLIADSVLITLLIWAGLIVFFGIRGSFK